MPSTFLKLHVHAVFSTKERYPFIKREIWEPLHAFLGSALRSAGAMPLIVGGVEDHVHALFGMKATHCLADIIRDLKTDSSKWMKHDAGIRGFGWQDGYGGFSVSASNIDAVRRYIAGQEEHHKKQTFEEEYVSLLTKHGIEFDPRFLF